MKKAILSFCILHFAFCISTALARSPEQIAQDLLILTNETGILRLEHPWDRQDAFRAMLGGGMKPDELSALLVSAAEALSKSKGVLDADARRFAVSALGEFGTTNALPFLERTMGGGDRFWSIAAMWAAVNLSDREPLALQRISSVLSDGRAGDASFHREVYSRIAVSFDYGRPSAASRKALCDFLVGLTAFETVAANDLDDLLCKVVPEFRESQERLRMAARLARAERDKGVENGRFQVLEASLRVKLEPPGQKKEGE